MSTEPSPFASMLASLILLVLLVGTFFVGREWGHREEHTLCRRTIQHRMVLSREDAESMLSEEARLWGEP